MQQSLIIRARDAEEVSIPLRLGRIHHRRTLLSTSISSAGARRETFTAFLLRALAREVARCRQEAEKSPSGMMRATEVEEQELIELLGTEALGL